jgi:hypothetical protein
MPAPSPTELRREGVDRLLAALVRELDPEDGQRDE